MGLLTPPRGGARRTRLVAAGAVGAVSIAALVVGDYAVGPRGGTASLTQATPAASGTNSGAATGGSVGLPGAPGKPGTSGAPDAAAAQSQADPPIDGLPTPEELARARADVAKLSPAALAGQVLVIGYDGKGTGNAASLMRASGAAGVIVLGGNVPVAAADRVPAMQNLAAAATAELTRTGRAWPALVGVDQEGGIVTRLAEPLTPFPAPMAVGAAGDPKLARAVAEASGRELRAAGFTMTFSPAGDVTDGRDAVIGTRSLAGEPELAGRMAVAMARGYADAGIVSTAKHFPGHGRLRTDSHVDRPVLSGSLESLLARDLAPFARLAAAGAPGVMAGHVVVPAVDPAAPATQSRPVLTGLLRERFRYGGLVVTDSMGMGAISRYAEPGPAAVAALAAGADVVLKPENPVAARDGIVAAMASGALPRPRVEEAAARLVATLRHAAVRARPTPGASGTDVPVSAAIGGNGAVAAELARGSIVQLGGTCGAPLVGSAITIEGGEAADRAALAAAARRAGLRVTGGAGQGVTRVALVGAPAMYAGTSYAGTARATRGDITVGLDNPTYLGMARADIAKVATFGRTTATWDALVAVLQGRARATAKMPMSIDGAPAGSGC
jgi:beta-N-acetylhexosaminidase